MHEKTMPCKWCGQPTTKFGTKMCDRCWELDHRIEGDPDLAAKILAAHGKFRAIPAEPVNKRHYVVEAKLSSGVTVIYETVTSGRDETEPTRIIRSLISQDDPPTRVFELVDASAEIAQAVADRLHSDGYPASKELRPFLERHGADERVS